MAKTTAQDIEQIDTANEDLAALLNAQDIGQIDTANDDLASLINQNQQGTRAKAPTIPTSGDPLASILGGVVDYSPLGVVPRTIAGLAGGGSKNTQGGVDQGPVQLANPAAEEAEIKKAGAKQSAATKQSAEQKALQNQIQQVENSPWTKLGNALAQQYQQTETPVVAAISGSGNAAAENASASNALGLLGLSPSSGAGQWLQSQTAAAEQNAAPVQQAMAQEGAQYAAQAGPISQAIQAYGQANALADITAPESAWLNALSSHITSNLSYQGYVPVAAESSLNPAVLEALKQSGGYPGATGSGTVALQNLVPNATGGVKATKTPAANAGSPTSVGVVPGASAAPA
jgi:hypothetical protein